MEIQADEKYGAMTGAQLEDFLGSAVMPMRLAFESPSGLLVVPLWFHFAAERLWACSPEHSLVIRSVRARPAVAFDVSTNDVPYRGVRGRGEAACLGAEGGRALDSVLAKYIDDDDHPLAQWLRARAAQEVAIAIEPTWITSWDFSERMQGVSSVRERTRGRPI